MTTFADGLFIGQHWQHKRTGELAKIDQIHRKDRQVKLVYVECDDAGMFEYKNFSLLQRYWIAKEILLDG